MQAKIQAPAQAPPRTSAATPGLQGFFMEVSFRT